MSQEAANASLVVIAVVMVLWTVAAGIALAKLAELLEKMHAKLDQIATDLRILSQKGEQVLSELQRMSVMARDQMSTTGTIIQDVRRWVDNVDNTSQVVKVLLGRGVVGGLSNVKAVAQGILGFWQHFVHRRAAQTATEVPTGKEQ